MLRGSMIIGSYRTKTRVFAKPSLAGGNSFQPTAMCRILSIQDILLDLRLLKFLYVRQVEGYIGNRVITSPWIYFLAFTHPIDGSSPFEIMLVPGTTKLDTCRPMELPHTDMTNTARLLEEYP